MARINKREVKETIFDGQWKSSGGGKAFTIENNFRRGSVHNTFSREGVSLFIGNLPVEMDTEWLYQIFRGAGEVIDAFIPLKRSYLHNEKFVFHQICS